MSRDPEDNQHARKTRRRDVVIAGHAGDEATARAARNDDDPQMRASALGALDRMGKLDDEELRERMRSSG